MSDQSKNLADSFSYPIQWLWCFLHFPWKSSQHQLWDASSSRDSLTSVPPVFHWFVACWLTCEICCGMRLECCNFHILIHEGWTRLLPTPRDHESALYRHHLPINIWREKEYRKKKLFNHSHFILTLEQYFQQATVKTKLADMLTWNWTTDSLNYWLPVHPKIR